MTNSPLTSVKRHKRVYSVACQTLLITGCISSPLKASKQYGTPFLVPYSGKSRSVGSKDRCTRDLAIRYSTYFTLLKSLADYGHRTCLAVRKRYWLNVSIYLYWLVYQHLYLKGILKPLEEILAQDAINLWHCKVVSERFVKVVALQP